VDPDGFDGQRLEACGSMVGDLLDAADGLDALLRSVS